jgi:hypothetical protein
MWPHKHEAVWMGEGGHREMESVSSTREALLAAPCERRSDLSWERGLALARSASMTIFWKQPVEEIVLFNDRTGVHRQWTLPMVLLVLALEATATLHM